MIGIVVVSHSERLAEGLLELIEPMVRGEAALALAGGVDIPDAPIGTDPVKVAAAIETLLAREDVSSVLVMMDLGSAIMSAEAALDFLSADQRARVYLCEAPLVEGTLAAAVRAKIGGTLAQVYADARGALVAKTEQLAAWQRLLPPLDTGQAWGAAGWRVHRRAVDCYPQPAGAARPSGRAIGDVVGAVRRASHAHTRRTHRRRDQLEPGRYPRRTRQRDVVTARARGAEAFVALEAIEALALDNFGDSIDVTEPTEIIAAAVAEDRETLQGIAAVEGVAFGPAFRLRTVAPEVEEQTIDDPAAERRRLTEAIAAVVEQLRTLRSELSRRAGPAEVGIFEAQILMITDSELQEVAQQAIELRHIDAASAWRQALQGVVSRYRALDDAYLARRAEDVLDAGQRVLRYLAGAPIDATVFAPPAPAILVANELKPSDVARLPLDQVLGIVTAEGGATGHSAILARALGIPAVTGVGAVATVIADGQHLALDGGAGLLWLAPDADLLAQLGEQRARWQAQRAAGQKDAQAPAITARRRPYRGGRQHQRCRPMSSWRWSTALKV
jgi:dihydroxyacetone kinase phosphotransfer subunit